MAPRHADGHAPASAHADVSSIGSHHSLRWRPAISPLTPPPITHDRVVAPPTASYDPDGPASDVAEGEELAAVAAPRDPGLVAGGGVPLEVAPRVALLCALQQMAEDAGTVWPPPAPAASSGHVNNGQMEGKKQEQQQKEEAESGVTAPPKRPVIVFGESPEWEEAERQEHGKQAGTEAESGQDAGTKAGAKAQGEEGEEGQGADYGAPPPPDPSHPSLLAGRLLWRQLAEAARTDPVLSTDKVRNGSELHRQKVGAGRGGELRRVGMGSSLVPYFGTGWIDGMREGQKL